MKSGYKKQFKIGNKVFPNNIFYAPICGYSDFSQREMSLKHEPGLVFCEMVKVEALIRKTNSTYKLLKYNRNRRPIAAQICGSSIDSIKNAAVMIEEMGFDLIDFNCGCPVPKVLKDGSGSAMLKAPDKIGEIIFEIKNLVSIPVTLKIRSGFDESSIIAPKIVKIAENAGADAITIHGRTKTQGYSGAVDLDVIKECKKVSKRIKIIGNGDLFTPLDVKNMFDYTHCDGVMIARGMLGKPFFVKMVENFYNEKEDYFNIDFLKNQMLEHFELLNKNEEKRKALIFMKKNAPFYLKNFLGIKKLRQNVAEAKSIEDLFALIKNFDYQDLNI